MSALKNIKGGEISILIHEHEKKTGKKKYGSLNIANILPLQIAGKQQCRFCTHIQL